MYSFPDCFWFLENSKVYTPVTETVRVFQRLLFILNNFEQEETSGKYSVRSFDFLPVWVFWKFDLPPKVIFLSPSANDIQIGLQQPKTLKCS